MKVIEPEESGRYVALYEATIQQAVGGASGLMARLAAHAREVLRGLEEQSSERRERDNHTHSRRLLNQFEATLCARFAEELLTAFSRMASVERAAPAAPSGLHFDQLAQMDDAALRHSVETARVEHVVQMGGDSALDELNRLICAMLGQPVVRLERNPLRPAVYVEALTAAVTHLPVPAGVRQHWITLMCAALGRELGAYYQQLCAQLRERGVDGGGIGSDTGAGLAPQAPRREAGLLTVEKLRQLLLGGRTGMRDAVAQRYETDGHDFADSQVDSGESVPTAFRATVPAALDAVREPRDQAQFVQRLQDHGAAVTRAMQGLPDDVDQPPLALDQALGQEVVALMVDNITHDQRLLAPVQAVVAALEPALLKLALVDPRFFSHKQHPARRLLHEITHRSIAYESVDSRGFSGFMEPLREAVAPLSQAAVDTAEPFDKALSQLVGLWDDAAGTEKRQVARAVKALRTAEQRNALAATIVEAVHGRPDVALVPDAVVDFLCGPWAQVVAHARMSDKGGADDPGGYAGFMDSLMWSAQPHLTRKKVPTLTRLVPKLLAKLREGLATIDYPAHKTSEFFDVLMQLHQRGFKSDAEGAGEAAPAPRALAPRAAGKSTWVAPLEAEASGFIDLSTGVQPLPVAAPAALELEVGAWAALQTEGVWTRTKLSWVSPNGTLMLFTDALGYMHTLTRLSCEHLFATGQLRVISTHLLEDALDAVARSAMRQSVDVRF